MDDTAWPDLEWEPSSQRVAWLVERTRALATRARAFEQALEEAQEAGEAPLSKAAAELELWERTCANLWMYVGLGEARRVPADEVPAHAEEVAKTYERLRELRGAILSRLGGAAAGVRSREGSVKVDEAGLRERAGELPSFQPELDALGAAILPIPVVGDEPPRPVTGDEFRQRQAAESRQLADPPTYAALLASAPPAWVQCAFDTIGLELPQELAGDEDDEEVELTTNSRTALQRRVLVERMDKELVRQVVFAVGEQDRELLGDLVAAGGQLRYGDVTGRYGADDADGYSWRERPPSGPLARLRRVALVFVGMSGKRMVVQLPSDLLPKVSAVLGEALDEAAQ